MPRTSLWVAGLVHRHGRVNELPASGAPRCRWLRDRAVMRGGYRLLAFYPGFLPTTYRVSLSKAALISGFPGVRHHHDFRGPFCLSRSCRSTAHPECVFWCHSLRRDFGVCAGTSLTASSCWVVSHAHGHAGEQTVAKTICRLESLGISGFRHIWAGGRHHGAGDDHDGP